MIYAVTYLAHLGDRLRELTIVADSEGEARKAAKIAKPGIIVTSVDEA